jgi:SAM-dependent methyltransferase
MDRSAWLKQQRRTAQERYDRLFAPTYDREWGAISPTHERFYRRFLELCPPRAFILDAACGTGKYWPLILGSGCTVLGIDQSLEMLRRAQAKYLTMPIRNVGLQEMHYRQAFDGASCMDAMEFVFPEDWPLVLDNLHCALKPGGYLYFTVEIADDSEIELAYAAGRQLGLPLVRGESAHEGGYHYYPKGEQLQEWLRQARFRLTEETVGDEYHHYLVQKA